MSQISPINRRYDPGRYRLVDRNSTPDRVPSDSVDDTAVDRPHDSHCTKRGTP
ncbi:hypothetical protein [Micromonospora sp. NPDC093277]|uniref:hypothetical protein n=1 Tax=Micromonospora sp. NPDC093277 TaxID=3364291 RepID=UPI003826C799